MQNPQGGASGRITRLYTSGGAGSTAKVATSNPLEIDCELQKSGALLLQATSPSTRLAGHAKRLCTNMVTIFLARKSTMLQLRSGPRSCWKLTSQLFLLNHVSMMSRRASPHPLLVGTRRGGLIRTRCFNYKHFGDIYLNESPYLGPILGGGRGDSFGPIRGGDAPSEAVSYRPPNLVSICALFLTST